MNSYRNYNTQNSGLSKNLEKLSSGYKINRAGDDAAGLAISEKMRAQITGLEVAQKNAKDGISVVQTAEGALTEVHDMLNRMYSLAEQSANGIYSETERDKLQAEMDQLTGEIDRIADSTNFNGINLLDGSLSGVDAAKAAASKVEVSGLTTYKDIVSNYGQYETKAIGTSAVTITANDTFTMTVKYTDGNGEEKELSKTLIVEKAPTGTSTNLNATLKILNEDGTKTALKVDDAVKAATAGKVSQNELTIAFRQAFQQDEEFSKEFALATSTDLSLSGTNAAAAAVNQDIGHTTAGAKSGRSAAYASALKTNAIGFWARKEGTEGASVQSVSVVFNDNDAKSGVETTTLLKESDSMYSSDINAGSDYHSGAVAAHDGFSAYDLSKAKVWSANGKNDSGNARQLEDAAFEINGEKFVFIKNGTNLSSGDLATLEAAGVKNYVTLQSSANKTTIYDADVYAMAQKIASATGLTVETGAAAAATTTVQKTASAKVKYDAGSDSFNAVDTFKARDKAGQLTDSGTTGVSTTANTWIKITPDAEAVKAAKAGGAGLVLQIGDTADEFNRLSVNVDDMHANALFGKEKLDITDADNVTAQTKSQNAMDTIKAAIDKVSETRGNMGALQNRLEHTINNLSVTRENLQDAEATIRDTDVAEEMMAYTKNNILNQAAQAMLAQANQLPQGVLQLLG